MLAVIPDQIHSDSMPDSFDDVLTGEVATAFNLLHYAMGIANESQFDADAFHTEDISLLMQNLGLVAIVETELRSVCAHRPLMIQIGFMIHAGILSGIRIRRKTGFNPWHIQEVCN